MEYFETIWRVYKAIKYIFYLQKFDSSFPLK